MPFSTARAFMASTISRDMALLLLDEVGLADVGVRDGDEAGVGGDRDLRLARADELAREGRVAVAGLARAHAGAPSEEATEVVGLGERARAAGRGHLERVVLADLGQQVGDALAEVQRDPFGMVDEEAEGVAADDLGKQHFDVRRRLGEARLDVGLQAAHPLLLPDNKKAGERPLSSMPARGPAPKAVPQNIAPLV